MEFLTTNQCPCLGIDPLQNQGMTLGCLVGLPVVLSPTVVPSPFERALVPGAPFEFVLRMMLSQSVSYISISCSTASAVTLFFGMIPLMVSTRLSAALIRASAGVKLGIVKYLCLKNTVLQMRECLVLVM